MGAYSPPLRLTGKALEAWAARVAPCADDVPPGAPAPDPPPGLAADRPLQDDEPVLELPAVASGTSR